MQSGRVERRLSANAFRVRATKVKALDSSVLGVTGGRQSAGRVSPADMARTFGSRCRRNVRGPLT